MGKMRGILIEVLRNAIREDLFIHRTRLSYLIDVFQEEIKNILKEDSENRNYTDHLEYLSMTGEKWNYYFYSVKDKIVFFYLDKHREKIGSFLKEEILNGDKFLFAMTHGGFFLTEEVILNV